MPCLPDGARNARPRTSPLRTSPATIVAFLSLLVTPQAAAAQAGRDSVRTDSTRVQPLEGVLVKAIRSADAAPISQKTIRRAAIEQRHFGQDVPLLLQGVSPSLTAHTETGTNWGYSYLRLRGLDQTRINITIDGVPLNDMEDQVLYFANFADLMANVNSVQVQRGVGTSTAGTASYAGSINFETMPLALGDAAGDVQVQVGSFGSQRVSAGFNSGLTDSRFAVYGRASALRTNGYRDHSGVMGRSAFLGAGWFGDRDIVKLTALVGLLADTLSYRGATLAQLAQNRRFNPLHPEEQDKFGQQMVALAWSRQATVATSLNTTVYRNSASGNYDYFDGDDRYRYSLAHAWYGVTSAVSHDRGALQATVGVNANTYARDHAAYLRPDLQSSLYSNTGHKQDASAFVKLALQTSRVLWFSDLQARHARFRYEPDARAGVTERSIDWTFFNPKVGATFQATDRLSAFASFGTTSREPARNDMFAGDDDMNEFNVDDIGDLSRVRPERVYDTEAGINYRRNAVSLQANVFNMAFRNDIAPIGTPTASGLIPRRNVGSSFRRGVEVDGEWRAHSRVILSGNATVSDNRIRQFTDSSRGEPRLLENVQPMLTPRFMTAQRVQLQAAPALALSVEGRYQSRAFLDNTGSEDRILPDFFILDAAARATWSRYAFVLRGVNLGDTQKFGSGSVSSSGSVRYFLLPARSVFLTAEMRF
jgi:iron complex outermembrane recepter protein